LIVAHREELLDQSLEKVQKANPQLMCSVEQGDRFSNSYSDVVIASIQTLAARKFHRLQRLLQRHNFRIVVVDEAHHAAASTYRTALVHLGFLPPADASGADEIESASFDDVDLMTKALNGWDAVAPKDRLLVGVTATPNRSDGIGLGAVFQSIAYSYDLKAAIDDGWLVPITPWCIETTENLDNVKLTHGDFNQKQLAEAVNTERRNRLAFDAWKMYAGDRSTLVFTVDVQHAHDMAREFRGQGIRAKAISGETDKEERRQTLRDYQSGEVQVITNCMVLTEGTDLPRTSCILHAKPTKSSTLYEQMTGRGLRLFDGKKDCVIIDVVDVARRHSLQTAPVLYGLPPSLNTKGDTLTKMSDDWDALKEKYPGFDAGAQLDRKRHSIQELLDRASTFSVWTVPDLGAFGAGRIMNWIKVGEADYRVQYPFQDGTEILAVSRDMLGKFDVSVTYRDGDRRTSNQRTIAAGVDSATAAAGLAEAYVQQQRPTVLKLKAPDAPWRAKPASEKQVALLQKLRVPIKWPMNAGQASDQIDLAMSRRGR
jgi:ATP-dependent helicase IRC3